MERTGAYSKMEFSEDKFEDQDHGKTDMFWVKMGLSELRIIIVL